MKPKLIFIYGPIAAGKLTVATELQKITTYKIFHNHLVNDFVHPLFSKNDLATMVKYRTREKIYYDMVAGLMESQENIIMTYAYAKSFVSASGLPDEVFVKKLKQVVEKNGGVFYPVFLTPTEKELYTRVRGESRKTFLKLTKVSVLKELMKRRGMYTPAPFKNNLIIDNTDIPAKVVAKNIKKHFKL